MKAHRRTAIGLVVLGVVLLLWLVGGSAYARYRERKVERAWAQSFGSFQSLLDRYPKTTTNETARQLENLAKPLGLDPRAKTATVQNAPDSSSSKPQASELSQGRYAVSEYLRVELRQPEAGLSPPLPEARAFFSAHEGELCALEDLLLDSPPPVWNYDAGLFSYKKEREIPHTGAMIAIERVLLARALEESARRRHCCQEEHRSLLEAKSRVSTDSRLEVSDRRDGGCDLASRRLAKDRRRRGYMASTLG